MSMHCSNRDRGSSRSVVISAAKPSRSARATTSPTSMVTLVTPGSVRTASASVCNAAASATEDGPGAADFFLQLHDAVDERLGGGRATGHVDVHRHHAVAAAHDRI